MALVTADRWTPVDAALRWHDTLKLLVASPVREPRDTARCRGFPRRDRNRTRTDVWCGSGAVSVHGRSTRLFVPSRGRARIAAISWRDACGTPRAFRVWHGGAGD